MENLTHGVQLIAQERQKQIEKHGYTAEWMSNNSEYYDQNQLLYAAHTLLSEDVKGIVYCVEPLNWDKEDFEKLCEKPKKDRIKIAAAFLAAELDRLEELED